MNTIKKEQAEFLYGLSHQNKETPDNTAETASKEYRKFREQCGYKDPVALDEIEEAYYLGMEKQKELMMKNATETSVKTDAGGYPYIPAIELYDYNENKPLAKEGDKVKLLIMKGG